MDSGHHIRAAFLEQARACKELGSPFTSRVCELLAARLQTGDPVSDHLLQWRATRSSSQPLIALRVTGALHGLVLEDLCPPLAIVYPPAEASDDALWRGIADAIRAHGSYILDRLTGAPQTNEVRRAAILLPGFLTVGEQTRLPLSLSEIGASAGLNLVWDQFGYTLGDLTWGADASPVQLAPVWHGAAVGNTVLAIKERSGCDLNPIDVDVREDRLRLLSYIWPDQTDRFERTRAAIDLVRQAGIRVDAADVLTWLPTRLNRDWTGSTHVIYHTIVWQYFPEAVQRAAEQMIRQAGERASPSAPLAWLRFEADDVTPGAALTLTLWPGGIEKQIARADFHGRWIDWQGW